MNDPRIDSILKRLDDLEASYGVEGEQLVPTFVLFNPVTGTIGAIFTGGLEIPEQPGTGALTTSVAITFSPLHGSGGTVVVPGAVAAIAAQYFIASGAHVLQMYSQPDANDFAGIQLASEEAGGSGTANVIAQAQDAANLIAFTKHILNSDGTSDFTQNVKNLSDLNNGATALDNIGGLDANENLADLINKATARANLGLGSAALQASTFFAQVANNLSDLANVATARANLGFGTANPLRMSSVGGISLSWSASVTGSVVVNHGLKDASGANLTPQACYPSLAFGTPAVVTGITYDPASMTSTQVTVYGVRPTSTTITLPITVLSVA